VLKTRILTSLVLIPLLLAAMYWLPSALLAMLFGVIILLGIREWAALSGLQDNQRVSYVAAVMLAGLVAVVPIVLMPLGKMPVMLLLAIFGLVILFWLWALLGLIFTRLGSFLYGSVPGRCLTGALVLIPAWQATVLLHTQDIKRPALLLLLFLMVWGADTFAYFAGHQFGRHKLAPSVSPGKTIEGVIGGMVAVLLLALLSGIYVWPLEGMKLLWWVMVCLFVGLISVLGDLVESKLKRVAGVKDSGTIVPGHGGVMDRIDALTAAAPAFAFGTLFLNWVWS